MNEEERDGKKRGDEMKGDERDEKKGEEGRKLRRKKKSEFALTRDRPIIPYMRKKMF